MFFKYQKHFLTVTVTKAMGDLMLQSVNKILTENFTPDQQPLDDQAPPPFDSQSANENSEAGLTNENSEAGSVGGGDACTVTTSTTSAFDSQVGRSNTFHYVRDSAKRSLYLFNQKFAFLQEI